MSRRNDIASRTRSVRLAQYRIAVPQTSERPNLRTRGIAGDTLHIMPTRSSFPSPPEHQTLAPPLRRCLGPSDIFGSRREMVEVSDCSLIADIAGVEG